MPAGYIKIDKDPVMVLNEGEEKFHPLDYNELIDEAASITLCVSGQKKVNYIEMPRTTSKIRNQELTTFDRFIVLGVDGSANVILIFTKKR